MIEYLSFLIFSSFKVSSIFVTSFEKTKIETVKAKLVNVPLLKNATINFECKLDKEIDAGNSTLFLGKVVASHINENNKTLYNFGKGYGEYLFKQFCLIDLWELQKCSNEFLLLHRRNRYNYLK